MDHLLKTKKTTKIQRNGRFTKNLFGELDKACFHHDMPNGDFQDLPRRAASDKVRRDKAFNITKNPKFDRYLRGLVSMAYKFFDKKSTLLADESV